MISSWRYKALSSKSILPSSANKVEAVENACDKLLGSQLITPQTDAKGLPVNQLLIEAGQNIKQELYLGYNININN
jgi:succinyl-CoA synthetase beta subunit